MADTQSSELSERELEILRLVATGASNKEIAKKLVISTNTVKVHLRNIFGKIGVASRTEAAMYAVRFGQVPNMGTPPQDEKTLTISEISKPSRVFNLRWWIPIGLILLLILVVGAMIWFRRSTAGISSPSMLATTNADRLKVIAPLSSARKDLAAATFEDQIYAIAGRTTGGITGLVERYNPVADKWDKRSPKPIPVSEVNAAIIGGLVYIPGGCFKTGGATDVLEVYDPIQDHWQERAKLPVTVCRYALVSFEGHLYLFGGWDGAKYLDTVLIYDPSRDVWSMGTPMPRPRGYTGAVIAAGRIFVIGGFDGIQALSSVDIYSPNREGTPGTPWSSAQALPEKRYAMGVASIADIVVVIGGKSDEKDDITLQALQYLPDVNQWQRIETEFPLYWSNMSLVTIGFQIYALGGEIDRTLIAKNLVYQAVFAIAIPIVK